jgi:hypothetical protein
MASLNMFSVLDDVSSDNVLVKKKPTPTVKKEVETKPVPKPVQQKKTEKEAPAEGFEQGKNLTFLKITSRTKERRKTKKPNWRSKTNRN